MHKCLNITIIFTVFLFSCQHRKRHITIAKSTGQTISNHSIETTLLSEEIRYYLIVKGVDFKSDSNSQIVHLNVQCKNMGHAPITLTDGVLMLRKDTNVYFYTEPEQVNRSGWGLYPNELIPLSSITADLVFKIPARVEGDLYYLPPPVEEDGDTLFYLEKLR